MDTSQHLAAYLSGDLDADERDALEAQLAGDPALRDRLERIRAADEALAELPEVELPDGFSERLHDRLAPEVEAVVGDELAARRGRRLPGWVPAAAAAALVVVVGAGVVLSAVGGGDDTATDAAAPEAAAGGDAADEDTAVAGQAEDADGAVGPRVVDDDRSLDADRLQQLAADPDVVQSLADGSLEDPVGTAAAWTSALGGDATDLGRFRGEGEAAQEDGTATLDDGSAADPLAGTRTAAAVPPLRQQGDVGPEDLDDVGRCVDVLFEEAATPVVPLYAELATDTDDTPVIVYAALGPDAEGDYRRVEVWMLERSSCTVRHLVQHDR